MPVPVSVVIPSWNGRRLLERFLPSVVAAAERRVAEGGSVEIVVIDDGSTDGTEAWVAARAGACPVPLRLVRHEENLGFGAAANRGVADAKLPFVWLLNNDVEVDGDAIGRLARAFDDDDPQLFAVHSRMVDLAANREVGTGKMGGFARGFLRVHRSFLPRPSAPGPFWSLFATGGSAIFRRSHFLSLGGFDLIFAPFYMEDVELSYRAWKRGLTVRFEPLSVVRHQFSSTIGPRAGRQVERISQRNRLIFNWVHVHDGWFLAAHTWWLLVLLVSAPFTMKIGFLQGFADALLRIPRIRSRRREERVRAVRSDRNVLQIFEEMEASGRIRAYDDPKELAGLRDTNARSE